MMVEDIPLKNAVLLWTAGYFEEGPQFAVRPLGHEDYWNPRFHCQGGACHGSWQELVRRSKWRPEELFARLLADLWEIVWLYEVPVRLCHEGMIVVPEYRERFGR